MKTITRADVAETIYEEIGLSRKDSTDVLDMILDEGAENARQVANKTLQRMKNAVGLGRKVRR